LGTFSQFEEHLVKHEKKLKFTTARRLTLDVRATRRVAVLS